jgi:hypothetical protein
MPMSRIVCERPSMRATMVSPSTTRATVALGGRLVGPGCVESPALGPEVQPGANTMAVAIDIVTLANHEDRRTTLLDGGTIEGGLAARHRSVLYRARHG